MPSWWDREISTGGTSREYLCNHWQEMSDEEIADALSRLTGLGVTRCAVKKQRLSLGILRDQQPIPSYAIPDPTGDIEPYKFRETGKNTGELIHIREICPEGAIKTVDEIIEASGLDMTVWRVGDKVVINKWPVGAKAEKKDIRWENGRIVEGYVKADGLTVAQLWQVKVPFIRIKPEPIHPVVQPIACDYEYKVPADPTDRGIRRSVIITDLHLGFKRLPLQLKTVPLHDPAVLDLALQVFKYCKADRLDILGDIFDLSDMSDKFLQMPEYSDFLQPAIEYGHRWLRRARDINKSARITLHEGNHDLRMPKALVRHLKAVYELRAADEIELPPAYSIPRLLALHKLGALWVGGYPDDKDWLNDELYLYHGDVARKGPGATARTIVESVDVSVICGHAHRNEMASRTIHRREERRTISARVVGCACHTDGRVPGSDSDEQWQKGIAVVDYDDLWYNVTMIPIEDNIAIYDGKIFRAEQEDR